MTAAGNTQPALLDLLDRPPTSTPPIARWLLDHLTARGLITADGLTRRARLRTCPRCKHTILAGLDDDRCALDAYVDPIPLNALGEMLARIEGRATYDLRRAGIRWELDHRHASAITHAPAGTTHRRDVLRQHQCGSRNLAEPEIAPTSFAEAQPIHYPDDPPF